MNWRFWRHNENPAPPVAHQQDWSGEPVRWDRMDYPDEHLLMQTKASHGERLMLLDLWRRIKRATTER